MTEGKGGGILDAFAKPEFADAMSRMGAGVQGVENYFRPANNQIPINYDPNQLLQRRLWEEKLLAAKNARAEKARMDAAYAGLLSPREQTNVDVDATEAEIQPAQPFGMSPQKAELYRTLPPNVGLPALLGEMNQEQYVPVESPLGRGGVGMRSTKTGEIKNYQKGREPLVRNFTEGDEIVTREYDYGNKRWVETARAPRYKPQEGASYQPQTKAAKLRADRKYLVDDLKLSEDAPEVRAIDRELADLGVPSGEKMRMREMVESGSRTIQTVIDEIMPGGQVDMGKVRSMWAELPFSEGRTVAAQFKEAAGLMLRLETGAQANAQEISNLAQRYMPLPWDDETTVSDKLTRFKQRFDTAQRIAEGREKPTSQSSTPTGKPKLGDVVDGYRFKGGNPANPGSWTKVK